MITLEQLKEIIDTEFRPPFEKAGLVQAEFDACGEKTLRLTIGRRDVWITADGEVAEAGTYLGPKPESRWRRVPSGSK
jgi:hypothetical protein